MLCSICHYDDMFCLEYISLSMFWRKRDAQQVDRTVLITRATGWSYLQSFPNKLGESNCKQGSEVLSGRCASPRRTWHICYLKPEEYATRSDTLAAWPYSWLQYHSIISDIPPQNLCTICIHLPRWSWSRASTLWKGLVVHRGHLCSTVVPSFLCWFLSNLV